MNHNFPDRYERLRRISGLDHDQVDRMLGLRAGTSEALERGQRKPTTPMTARLAHILKRSPEYLSPKVADIQKAISFAEYTLAERFYGQREAEALWRYGKAARGEASLDFWRQVDEQRCLGKGQMK